MKRLLAIVITLVWVLTACSGNKTADTPTPTAAPSQEVQATEAAPQTVAPETGLQTLTPGKLTIATGQPAWEPWVLNDDPESGEGFEAAVAYAVAGKLGFAKEDVVWVRTSFEAAIQPGLKDFDFNLQQYSITDERKQVVDFSSAYYKEPRVVITRQDGDYASATSIAELKSALFGAASGDIAVEYTKTAIAPDQEVAVFNDLVAVLQALNSGQIDATTVGVAEGDYIISSGQVENGVILGKIPGSEEATGGLGLLLEKDSPITAAVTKAVDDLVADGTIKGLEAKYLLQYQVPDLSAEAATVALQTLTPGKLTIATGQPAWEPWVLNDDPESGEGFEAAVAYAVAGKLGFAKEDVVWVRTSFEAAIQPGLKDFDFNLQQYSITDERKQVVDFSSAYYKEPRVVITRKDGDFASATSIADLKGALFGAASGDIAVEYTKTAIAPDQEVAVFNDLVAVLQALNSGQIDATTVGVAEGDYIISSEQVENGVILGKIPGSEEATGGLGLLLEKDSPITAAVTKAVDDLVADGTIKGLEEKYLLQYQVADLK